MGSHEPAYPKAGSGTKNNYTKSVKTNKNIALARKNQKQVYFETKQVQKTVKTQKS